MVSVKEILEHAKTGATDFAKDVGGRTVVAVAGTPVGREIIDRGIRGFLGSEEIRRATAQEAAKEIVQVKTDIVDNGNTYLKKAATEMGVGETAGWKDIYNTIKGEHDFILMKPVKAIFSMILSGAMNAASFFALKTVNKALVPAGDRSVAEQSTVKSFFIGLMSEAFGFLKARPKPAAA